MTINIDNESEGENFSMGLMVYFLMVYSVLFGDRGNLGKL